MKKSSLIQILPIIAAILAIAGTSAIQLYKSFNPDYKDIDHINDLKNYGFYVIVHEDNAEDIRLAEKIKNQVVTHDLFREAKVLTRGDLYFNRVDFPVGHEIRFNVGEDQVAVALNTYLSQHLDVKSKNKAIPPDLKRSDYTISLFIDQIEE